MSISSPATRPRPTATPPGSQGHLPTLVSCFLHFDVSFMLWVLPGALGVYIAEDLALSPAEKGLVVATPILSGSLLRVPVGLLSDRLGAKRVGVSILAFLYLPLTLGWLTGDSLSVWLGVGLLFGTAGASFAVALPLASRWYAAERQGLVMGIAAAGNSGTVIANLAAPRLAGLVGWHNVLGLAMLPLSLVLLVFLLAARDLPVSSRRGRSGDAVSIVRRADVWWFCFFYSITFGGYVGLSSFFPIFLRDQYGVSPVTAGYLTAAIALAGSSLRPVGGHLADRFGGVQLLSFVLLAVGALYAAIAASPALVTLMALALVGVACLGLGNGAVFQLVPRRFGEEIGLATGIIGACGGLGGFFLPNLLGGVRGASGSFGPGFLVLAGCCLTGLILLRSLAAISDGWRSAWGGRMAYSAAASLRRVQMAPYLV